MPTNTIHVLCRAYHWLGVSVWVVCAYARSLVVSVASVLCTVIVRGGRSEVAICGVV